MSQHEHTNNDPPRYEHIVSRWEMAKATITGHAPRAICGKSAEGTPVHPVCPRCAAKDPHTAATLEAGHTTG